MRNFLKDIKILQMNNFKYLLSISCGPLAPDDLNLVIILPIAKVLIKFSVLLTAFSGLNVVFTSFYDPT